MRVARCPYAEAFALAVLAASGCSQSEDDPDAFARSNYCAEVVATVAEGARINDVVVDGDRLYYTSNDSFIVMDNTDRSHPVPIIRVPTRSRAFAIEGNLAIFESIIIDLDLYMGKPTEVSPVREEMIFKDSIISSSGVCYTNPFLYPEQSGLQTYDPSGLSAPYLVQVSKGWWWFSAAIEGDTLATGGNSGLDLFDISDPLRPHWLASANPSELIMWLAVSNHTVYAGGYDFDGSEEYGWAVYDIADPNHPKLVDSNDTRNIHELKATEIFLILSGRGAYSETHNSMGLRIYDLSDRLKPKWIGVYDPIGSPMAMDGDTLYLSLNEGGLQILDLSGCRAEGD